MTVAELGNFENYSVAELGSFESHSVAELGDFDAPNFDHYLLSQI